ncbi:MAG: hypothetical protein IPG58_06055 [Acidobacteria bacterium]|nr:hypothetical protein [Acidobacteriota bacterium]
MSFTLIDQGSENFELPVSVWNWKAAVEVIRHLDIVGEGAMRQMGYAATGVTIACNDAHEIGTRIQSEIWLPRLTPGKRMFADLSITDAPDDKTIYRDGDEEEKL